MPTVTLDGTKVHYLDSRGGEPAVLLLHAFPLSSAMWDEQVAALSPRHRVIAPDFKGFGGSDAPPDVEAYTIDGYADDVAALLDRLGVERVVVAGLSMGGYVAFSLLRRHRARVAALVLADTRAEADAAEVVARRTTQQRQVAEGNKEAVIEALLEGLLSERTHRERPEVVARARRLMDNPPTGFIGALEAMKHRRDSTADLASIEVPTAVVVGEHDRPSPPPVAEAMHRAIPGSSLVVLADAGHLSNLEAPEDFSGALAALAASVPH